MRPFAGSAADGQALAIAAALVETATPSKINPHACLADTRARIPDRKITRGGDPMPRTSRNCPARCS